MRAWPAAVVADARRELRDTEGRVYLLGYTGHPEQRLVAGVFRRGDEGEIEIVAACGSLQVRDRFVEQRHDFAHVALTVAIMRGRPVGQRLSRLRRPVQRRVFVR